MSSRAITFRWHRWEHPSGTQRRSLVCDRCGCIGSHPADPLAPEAEHVKASKLHVCMPGTWYWDAWQHEAFDRGMEPETAAAGRALLREHHNHAWGGALDPEAMLLRGLAHPKAMRRRWQRLLTEGNALELEGRRPVVRDGLELHPDRSGEPS